MIVQSKTPTDVPSPRLFQSSLHHVLLTSLSHASVWIRVGLHAASEWSSRHSTTQPRSLTHSSTLSRCQSNLVRVFTPSILSWPMCFTHRDPLSCHIRRLPSTPHRLTAHLSASPKSSLRMPRTPTGLLYCTRVSACINSLPQ